MRTLLINVLVFLLMLVALVLLPPLGYDAYQALRQTFSAGDPRAGLPNYRGVEWAGQHFREFARVSTIYFDFIGWRRAPFAGTTINIDAQGYRVHPQAPRREEAQVWFFGGSTTWGPGASDAHTIPARLQQRAGRTVFNFGESAYTAHQSYNLLMKSYLQGGKPGHVVFYDGANEVVIKCRAELGFYSTSHEATIRDRMHSTQLSMQLLSPTLELLSRGLRTIGAAARSDMGYDCHDNEAKRRAIAAALVMDWSLARDLVEKNGGKFLAVLQPVSFTGSPQLEHLPEVRASAPLKAQYDAVYPELKRQLEAAGIAYADLTTMFDGKEHLYIDFAHVSPRGNDIAAARISALLH